MKDIDLTKILKAGQEIYCPVFGHGRVETVSYESDSYPIFVEFPDCGCGKCFTKKGKYLHDNDKDTECVLFPSKDNRDWSKYRPKKSKYDFKPFERVLCRSSSNDEWIADLFSHYPNDVDDMDVDNMVVAIGGRHYFYCIPYEGNEHLLGTSKSELQ